MSIHCVHQPKVIRQRSSGPGRGCPSLQPLGLDLCPSLQSLSPWGDRAALVYCSWGVCMSPHSYVCALQVLCCIVFTASLCSCRKGEHMWVAMCQEGYQSRYLFHPDNSASSRRPCIGLLGRRLSADFILCARRSIGIDIYSIPIILPAHDGPV